MGELKIVKGNSFSTLIKVRAFGYDGIEIPDFNLSDVTHIKLVVHVGSLNIELKDEDFEILENNLLKITWNGKQNLGLYLLEAFGVYRDLHWRFFDKEPIFTIVNTNAEANIPSQSILDDDFYNITSTELRITSDIVENKLDYIGEDNYVYKWDRELGEYVKSDIYVKGDTGDQGPIGPRGYMGLRGLEGESAYQIALDNGFIGTEQQWLDSLKADATQEIAAVNARVDNLAARIHVGQFNANDITEEGWYDSVVLGRPVGSESDEKYFLYMSSNGGQVCFSRRNSGKVYHRLGLGHKWVAVTHDDYGRSEANASSLKVYPANEEYLFLFEGEHLVSPEGSDCQEVYSGDNIEVPSFDLYYGVTLDPDDIVEVNCFYRRGNSYEFNNYKYDSDAYIYISNVGPGSTETELNIKSDYIKIKSLGSLELNIVDGSQYQDLAIAELILQTKCGRHFVKYTGTQTALVWIRINGDFTTRSSWLAIYKPGCVIHKAKSLNIILA